MTMDQETKDKIAQEKFGKSFEECSTSEKRSVGGTFGGNKRKEDMAEETGGDVHKAYSEMSTQTGGGTGGRETEGQE